MEPELLRATAFRGDPDVPELHAFFQPERQFAGDTRWTFGTSLKAAYVNCFEFLNEAPIVQLWRDASDRVQTVSRIHLGAGEWFFQAAPGFRKTQVTHAILEQADAAMRLLSNHVSWRTVCHESDRELATLLSAGGYAADGFDEVYMTRSLVAPVVVSSDPAGCEVRLLDRKLVAEVASRGAAQVDAFRGDQPYDEIAAWMSRTVPHQLAYARPHPQPHVIAVDSAGTVLAFADVFLDRENGIGEFEPVGTRRGAQRRGLAKAVLTRGLGEMQAAGMMQAVVRTGHDNAAAIAAYESVGFEIGDRRVSYRKPR